MFARVMDTDPYCYSKLCAHIRNASQLPCEYPQILAGLLQHVADVEVANTLSTFNSVELRLITKVMIMDLREARNSGVETTQIADEQTLKLLERLGTTRFVDVDVNTNGNRYSETRESVMERQESGCPITHRLGSLEAAHVIPHSVTAISSKKASNFWSLLTILLGPEDCNLLWQMCRQELGGAPTNIILLDSFLHNEWDNLNIDLAPVGPRLSAHIDIQFRVRTDSFDIKKWSVFVPVAVEDQDSQGQNDPEYPRRLEHGNEFRLFTKDPAKLPLPSYDLLELRLFIQDFLASTGYIQSRALAGSSRARKRVRTDTIGGSGASEGGSDRGNTRGLVDGRGQPKGRGQSRNPIVADGLTSQDDGTGASSSNVCTVPQDQDSEYTDYWEYHYSEEAETLFGPIDQRVSNVWRREGYDDEGEHQRESKPESG